MSDPVSTYAAQYSGDNVMKNVPLTSGTYKTFSDGYKLAGTIGKGDAEGAASDVTSVASDVTGFAGAKVEETTSLLNKIISVLKKIMDKIKEIGGNLKYPLQTFMDGAGKGGKALEDVDTEGKTASQIFNEAIGKNLTPGKVGEIAGDKALGEIGLPGKKNLDDPSNMSTLDAISAGTNLVNKDWGWGDKAGKAAVYDADPGACTESQDKHK